MGKVSGGAGRSTGRSRIPAGGGATGAIAPAPETVAAAVSAPPQQTAGLIGESTRSTKYSSLYEADITSYRFETVSGNQVEMQVYARGRNADVVFTVNDNTRMAGLPQAEANAVSMRLMRHLRDDAKTRSNGFRYQANAYTDDGMSNGARRAVAYNAIGLTRPDRARPGESQHGIVRNGKIEPDTHQLQLMEGPEFSFYNQAWKRQVDTFRNNRNARR